MVRSTKLVVALCLVGLLAIPAFANSGGPPYLNSDNQETAKYGCTCHYSSPGDRAVVMVSGVPVMYESDQSYEFVITVADSVTLAGADGNTKAGFLLTDNGAGTFSWDDSQEIREADGDENAISHSETGDGVWTITWTAPSSDSDTILFSIAGNSVNGDGIPNEYDYWNVLTFPLIHQVLLLWEMVMQPCKLEQLPLVITKHSSSLKKVRLKKKKNDKSTFPIESLKVVTCFTGLPLPP